jgi:Condensation domain
MHPLADRKGPTPTGGRELSLGQEALWFIQGLHPESSAYNIAVALTLHFPVDLAHLTSAVRRTLLGHEPLRSVFRVADGEVRRFPRFAATSPVVEVHHVSDRDDHDVRRIAQTLAQRPFRLDRESPIRVTLLRRSGGEDVLLVTAHHMVADDVSQLLLIREVLTRYAAAPPPDSEQPPNSEEEPDSEQAAEDPERGEDVADGEDGEGREDGVADFDTFVRREREFLASPKGAAAGNYWRGELERGPAVLDLPTDRPRPPVYRFEGAEVDFELPRDTVAAAERAAREQNATSFGYLLTVFQLLLYKLSGQPVFIVGYPVTQRSARAFRESVGYFVNTLPMCVEIDPEGSFPALLHRTRHQLWHGLAHRAYPFAMMPRLLRSGRDVSRPGLVQAMFVMNGGNSDDPFFAVVLPGRRVEHAGLGVSTLDVPQQLGQVDLTLHLVRYGSAVHGKVKYNTSMYDEKTAQYLADAYVRLLDRAAGGTLPARLREISD